MDTERVMIIGGRHGAKTADGNDITPVSKARVYAQGEKVIVPFVKEYITQEQVLGFGSRDLGLTSSPRRRALMTGLVRYAPVLGINFENLDEVLANGQNMHLSKILINHRDDRRLDYTDDDFNMDVLKGDGIAAVVDHNLAHPYARAHAGVSINTPVNLLLSGASMWTDALREMSGGRRLLQLVSHGHTWDFATAALLNSARETPITNSVQYGGHFKEEDFATLTMDRAKRSGTLSNPVFERNGQRYPVNLNMFTA